MPLPLKTFRVLPNPWLHIDPFRGPQSRTLRAPREDGPLRYVGAVVGIDVVEQRKKTDPRGNREFGFVTYPALDAALLKGEPETVSALAPDGHYYRDRLACGELIPGDEATARAVPDAPFKTLQEAKDFGVKKFDAELGEGSWKELEKMVVDQAKADRKVDKPAEQPASTETPNKSGKAGS
jgi:hypothetical protein